VTELAKERIIILFEKAEERMDEEREELADRYVELAQRIGEKTQRQIPGELKKKYCSECYTYLIAGKNCKVRVKTGQRKITYRCENCGASQSYGLSEEVEER
jgi:ribonuclease P protein subunit RPR2